MAEEENKVVVQSSWEICKEMRHRADRRMAGYVCDS